MHNTFILISLLCIGCGDPVPQGRKAATAPVSLSDAKKVRSADYSILFVGNSHTSFFDLPNLVQRMIEFQEPKKTTFSKTIGTGFLEDAAKDMMCIGEINERPWKFVILQAQKISSSGKFKYSQEGGIYLAKQAKAKGANVFYFCEWGLQGKAGDGDSNEKIYNEMAKAAEVKVACVNRAWDGALKERPKLELYNPDGNHQSATGAFLTACVLTSYITGKDPSGLAKFPYEEASEDVRTFLAGQAKIVWEKK